ARSKAPLCGSPVPTLSIVVMPASWAREITSSRSASYSGPSMWQWESMKGIYEQSMIFQLDVIGLNCERTELIFRKLATFESFEAERSVFGVHGNLPHFHRHGADNCVQIVPV